MLPLSSTKTKGLIIHHWDTDGICSAAIILEYIGKEIDTFIPQIGNYYLTDDEILKISHKGYDWIIIADMAIPKDNVLQIKAESGADIYIFDHHLQDIIEGVNHYNPVSMGEPVEKYPSCTWVLSKYLNREIDLFSILGAVGDNEIKIRDNRYIFSAIEKVLDNLNITFENLLTMVELIDSNYKIDSRKTAISAVSFIRKYRLTPGYILNNNEWHQNLEKLNKEIAYQSNMPVLSIGDIAIQDIRTQYNIISTLTRQLAWNYTSKVSIVKNKGYFKKDDQIYIRTGSPDVILKPLINYAIDKGYSAGGKREVVGIVLPKEDTDNFINEVIERLQ